MRHICHPSTSRGIRPYRANYLVKSLPDWPLAQLLTWVSMWLEQSSKAFVEGKKICWVMMPSRRLNIYSFSVRVLETFGKWYKSGGNLMITPKTCKIWSCGVTRLLFLIDQKIVLMQSSNQQLGIYGGIGIDFVLTRLLGKILLKMKSKLYLSLS